MFPKAVIKDVNGYPIPETSEEKQQPFIEKANVLLEGCTNLNNQKRNFLNLMISEFAVKEVSEKLKNWETLVFSTFLNEIENKIKPQKLTLQEKSEWMQHFETEKAKAIALKNEIDRLDAEIDQMVYALYGLSPEEISIIEGQT